MAGESKDVTMVVLAQLREDVAEFERLLLQATRRKAKDVLSLEIRKLQTEIVTRQESLEKLDKLATDAQPKPPTNNVSAAPRRYTKELTTYGRPNTSYVHVGRNLNLWICAIHDHGSRGAAQSMDAYPVVVVVVFISTVQHQLVSTAINVYNTDIMES